MGSDIDAFEECLIGMLTQSERIEPRLHSPGAVSDYRLLFATVLIQRGLDSVVKSAPVVFTDCNASEWLQGAGNRNEHFCCAEHQASLRPEHQLTAEP